MLREPVENQRTLGRHAGRVSPTASSRLNRRRARRVQFPLEQVEKANLKFEW